MMVLQPDDPYNYIRRAQAHVRLGNIEQAEEDLAIVRQLLTEEARPAYLAATVYAQLSAATEACNMLREALRRDLSLIQQVHTNPDVDPIRDTSDFQNLLAEFPLPQNEVT